MPLLKSTNESGQTWEDPSEDALFMFMEDIEQGEEAFLIVELLADPSGQTFIQSTRNDDGTYVVEFREGSPSQHFGTVVDDMGAAHALIASWSFGLDGWRESVEWTKIPFDE
ncbi:hypothetical protein AB4Y87_19785 [Paenarthrobacter sp. RAF54_2]|uniref:hypothetical protein n=1 Tax=Paenarthrobacter sp. RAF54_2 TaxID=3233061 RepID=UPI003F9689EF